MSKFHLFFIISALLIASGANKSSASSNETEDSASNEMFPVKTVVINDSTGRGDMDMAIHLKLDRPEGSNEISSAVSSWIEKQLEVSSLSDDALQSYAHRYITDTKASLMSMGGSRDVTINCELANDKVVSYLYNYNDTYDMGWDHGTNGVTFDISNAKALSWDIISPSKQLLFETIFVVEMTRATSDGARLTNDNIQFNYENMGTESSIPPVFTKDGIYCYVDNFRNMTASFTIPYDAIRDVVRPEIAKLFPPKQTPTTLLEQRKALLPDLVQKLYADYELRNSIMTDEFKRVEHLSDSITDEVGDAPTIDWDPWVGGQDTLGYEVYVIGDIDMPTPDKCQVSIVQTQGDKSISNRFSRICTVIDFVWQDGQWRVNDVGGVLDLYKDFLKSCGISY